jgi:hypothetical protein
LSLKICDALFLYGYDDWFLPSFEELLEMRDQQILIGGFTNGWYYSSTTDDPDYMAKDATFPGPYTGALNKSLNDHVRAIRTFTIDFT